MGIRETQIIGLPGEAEEFLKNNVKMIPGEHCPKCGEVIRWKQRKEVLENAKNYGMFDDGPVLHRYHLVDGSTVEEAIQCSPWSSGPCIFLMLKRGEEVLFEWSEDEINRTIVPEELPEMSCGPEEDI